MRWVLRLEQADLPSLELGSIRQMGLDALRFGQEEAAGVNLSGLVSGMSLEVHAGDETFPRRTIKALQALQEEVRAGLQMLTSGKAWGLPAVPSKIGLVPAHADVGEHWAGHADDTSRYLVHRYQGSFEATFYARVADVVVAWWERVHPCAAPTCRRLFLRDDPRQRYCSPACSQKTCWENFAPTRVRNYKAEYAARIAQLHGPKVKPRHRAR